MKEKIHRVLLQRRGGKVSTPVFICCEGKKHDFPLQRKDSYDTYLSVNDLKDMTPWRYDNDSTVLELTRRMWTDGCMGVREVDGKTAFHAGKMFDSGSNSWKGHYRFENGQFACFE
ncbi:MAG: hypothetical protein L6Q29_03675 [Candidatus Pacebacteria bacterium]|nr:hypothetical protein [Candidatus Paceibacterota bacterium]NUQ57643.1 hypothetical protein [Candidatus Paceibacter sp.]